MPVFAVTYVYGPDTETRMAHRPAHREWQSQLHEAGTVLASGPLDDEPTPGGLLIMQAADKQEITRLLADDPYASIGVIAETSVRGWTPVFGPLAAN
ncbi:YciI family protein [Brevibacterium sp.]|uniref:YciI family protein n=1 Tax=Brevibacterium sp. TaxID=1701 RepID=UPI0028119373|nr:YciI family protein [Brevibacterium sp.]